MSVDDRPRAAEDRPVDPSPGEIRRNWPPSRRLPSRGLGLWLIAALVVVAVLAAIVAGQDQAPDMPAASSSPEAPVPGQGNTAVPGDTANTQ